jgi:hypothetical protein
VSRKTRVRQKRIVHIRAGLAKRLGALQREIVPIEKSLAEIAERVDARALLVSPPTDLPSFEPEEAEVVIVQLAAPARKRRWSTRDERQQTLVSRLQKSPAAHAPCTGPTGAREFFDEPAEEASVVIIVPERGRAMPPPLPDRNRDI